MKYLTVCISIAVFLYGCADVKPRCSGIFKKTRSAYRTMQTYRSRVDIKKVLKVNDKIICTHNTHAAVLLKKPDYYLISWSGKNNGPQNISVLQPESGAFWSNGSDEYFYIKNKNAYTQDQLSDKPLMVFCLNPEEIYPVVPHGIPGLFYPLPKNQNDIFSQLVAPRIVGTEKIGEEECYMIKETIAKENNGHEKDCEKTLWISKSTYLLRKYSQYTKEESLSWDITDSAQKKLQKIFDALDRKYIRSKGWKLEALQSLGDTYKTELDEVITTETYNNIDNPSLTKDDFTFRMPDNAELTEDLFSPVMGVSEKDPENIKYNTKAEKKPDEYYAKHIIGIWKGKHDGGIYVNKYEPNGAVRCQGIHKELPWKKFTNYDDIYNWRVKKGYIILEGKDNCFRYLILKLTENKFIYGAHGTEFTAYRIK